MKQTIQLRAPEYTKPVTMEKKVVQPNFTPVVACVWWGDKYHFDYVRRLKAAVDKHMMMPCQFHVLTDRYDMVDDLGALGCDVIPAAEGIKGWWQKVVLFDRDLWDRDTKVLMLDLDTVITGPLDDFYYSNHHTTAIANFGVNYRHSKYNSSVVCWDAHGPAGRVYDHFTTMPDQIMDQLHGDQCWFWRVMVDDVRTWPVDWCMSYKYSLRGKALPDNLRAAIFHGKPDPHECREPWIVENWHNLLDN